MYTESMETPDLMPREDWRNRYLRMAISSSILLVTTTLWTILRILSRRIGHFKFQLEDYIYFLGQVWFYGVAACAITLVAVGPPKNEHIMGVKYQVMLPLRLCYAMVLLCVKSSILLLIRRIFSQGSSFVTSACWVALGFSISWAIYAGLIELFYCTPVESAWNPNIRTKRCLDKRVAYGAIPAIDIPLEIFILCIPLRSILGLQISKPHKIGLLVMFSAGIVTICLSVVYLYFIIEDFHKSYMVCIIHSGISLMVASSTVLQPLFNTTMRRLNIMVQPSEPSWGNKSGGPENPNYALQERGHNRVTEIEEEISHEPGLEEAVSRPQSTLTLNSRTLRLDLGDKWHHE